jgi:hypothetical protein
MAGRSHEADNQSRQYLSPREFSKVSGLSLATVRRYLKGGKLPYLQPGGRRGRILIPVDILTAIPPSVSDAIHISDPGSLSLIPGEMESGAARLPGPQPRWTRRAYPRGPQEK